MKAENNEIKPCCSDLAVPLFDQIIIVLDRTADEMKIQSAEASLEGDFASVNAIASRFERLLDYRKKLVRLQREWSKITLLERTKLRIKSKNKLAAEGKMRVIFSDEIIEKATNADTFSAALIKIGLERVAVLEKMVNDVPLVSYRSKKGKENPLFDGQWRIQTDMSDFLKRKLLKSIAKKFSIDLTIEFIPDNTHMPDVQRQKSDSGSILEAAPDCLLESSFSKSDTV